jgi:hypothetical protein
MLLLPDCLNQSLQLPAYLAISGVVCIGKSCHIHEIGLDRLRMLARIVKCGRAVGTT